MEPARTTPTPDRGSDRVGSGVAPVWLGWLLPAGFVALAGILLAVSRVGGVVAPAAAVVDPESLRVGPRRTAMTDPPQIIVAEMPENCNACHQIFRSNSSAGAELNYHQEIRLGHGMNNRCVNCHDAENRERLTLRDGVTVPFADTPQLCAQCHGTVYRDWERGTHGKTLGSWVTNSDAQRRLSCNECHNPHVPKYDSYKPLPAPNTLRMGEQGAMPTHGSHEKQSPLQRWLRELEPKQTLPSKTTGGHR